MKKLLILLFGTLVGLPALSQTKLAEVVKVWETKRVAVADGFTFKYKLWDGYDTAIYYNTGSDTFEVTTTFRKFKPAPPLPDLISTLDDNVITTAQAYNPATNAGDNIYVASGWSHMKNQAWNATHWEKTASFIDGVPGAYIEVTCICYKIEWWTEKRENHGIASVQKLKEETVNGTTSWVPDGPAVDVDLYAARTDNNSLLVYTTPTMMNATNKVRFSFTGRKNPAATQSNILHDKFTIYRKQ